MASAACPSKIVLHIQKHHPDFRFHKFAIFLRGAAHHILDGTCRVWALAVILEVIMFRCIPFSFCEPCVARKLCPSSISIAFHPDFLQKPARGGCITANGQPLHSGKSPAHHLTTAQRKQAVSTTQQAAPVPVSLPLLCHAHALSLRGASPDNVRWWPAEKAGAGSQLPQVGTPQKMHPPSHEAQDIQRSHSLRPALRQALITGTPCRKSDWSMMCGRYRVSSGRNKFGCKRMHQY